VLDRTRFVSYRDRAGEFFLGMNDEAELGRFNAAALLGIHAAIALTDAVVAHKVVRPQALTPAEPSDLVRLYPGRTMWPTMTATRRPTRTNCSAYVVTWSGSLPGLTRTSARCGRSLYKEDDDGEP